DEFYAIQKKAQQLGIGIWSLENYAQSDGFHSQSGGNNSINSTHNFQKNGSQNNSVNTRPSLNCEGKIKGNKNSHIYHLPGDTFYKSTKKNIVWFCAEQDAINAGYHKSKR
ncbi:MAG: thermonuclease, partial [Bacillota bacterium]|nr:thermonuclease [Bacillota bacterium]